MSKPMSGVVVGIESFIDLIGRATAWVALAMISLVAINVILRYSMSVGSVWGQELEWHLLAALILLGMCYALQRGENVRVDLFYAQYSPRAKFVVDLVSHGLLMVIAVIFIKVSLAYVFQAYDIGESSPDPGGIPYRWVVKSLIPLGYGLLLIQTFGAMLRLLLTGPQPGESHDV